MAGELLMSVSQDEREQAVNRSRRMYQTDLASDMATVLDRGIAQGRAEVARNALMNGLSIDVIHTITGLDMDTIRNLGASANKALQ
jgi:hypothetical protein